MASMKIIDKYGFIIFAIVAFLSFGFCLYKLCKETRETQRRDNLQLQLGTKINN